MRQVPHLILILLLSVACNYRSEPERALQAYIEAVNAGRCSDALKLLSARTRHGLEMLKERPQRPQVPAPVEEYYCGRFLFDACKPSKMKVDAQHGEVASISMPCGRTQDGIFPGFSSPFLKYEPRVTELVRENGEWLVTVPMVIRITEIREQEDRMRQDVLRRQEQARRQRAETSTKDTGPPAGIAR